MTIEEIKRYIHLLRQLRASDQWKANQDTINRNDAQLHAQGLRIQWSQEDEDYVLLLNEETDLETEECERR